MDALRCADSRQARHVLQLLLAACVLLAACPWSTAAAATRTVANCNDGGPGSLREAIGLAADGDTVDLRQLTCGTIATQSTLEIRPPSLVLLGPGRFALTIQGNGSVSTLRHYGEGGTLRISGMTITGGRGFDSPGGCIYSRGNLELVRSRVHRCVVDGFADWAPAETWGAGIYALGNVLVSYSSVYYNKALQEGHGGGIAAFGKLTLDHSQVYGNTAYSGGGVLAFNGLAAIYSLVHGNRATTGAGVDVGGTATINKSTISGNTGVEFLDADLDGAIDPSTAAGIYKWGTSDLLVIDSTISGNAANMHAAAESQEPTRILNSTIAFNRDGTPSGGCDHGILGLARLEARNSIIAANTCGGAPGWDVGDPWSPPVVTGSHNLFGRIGTVSGSPPADTIYGDPRLAPLAENGGPTRTHLLLGDSPAIDRGANLYNRQYDQRGPGFPRVRGAATDIGATEYRR